MPFFAVAKGRKPGIYKTREECDEQVDGFPGAHYRKFSTLERANQFIDDNSNRNRLPSFFGEPFNKRVKSSEKDVEITSDGSIVAYIHGAWVNNGHKENLVGFGVFWADNHPSNVFQLIDEERDNNQPNRAEIQASIKAIRQAKENGHKRIIVRTGEDYLINSVTRSLDRWPKFDWIRPNGERVVNKKDFQELIDVKSDMERVTWEKVYAGNYGYEMAVKLASGEVKIEKDADNLLVANSSDAKSKISAVSIVGGGGEGGGAISTLKKKAAFYAVAIGHERGIYKTLEEYIKQIDGFAGIHGIFDTLKEAEKFMKENSKLKDLPSYHGESFKERDKRLYFEVTRDGQIVAYIHGGLINSQEGNSVGFGVFWADNHENNMSQQLDEERDSNQLNFDELQAAITAINRAEIKAAIAAIQQAKLNGYKRIVIRTSSNYLINSATCWIDRWLENKWIASNGKPVKNKQDFEKLIDDMSRMKRVTWEKVHKGIYGYDKAIKLVKDKIKS